MATPSSARLPKSVRSAVRRGPEALSQLRTQGPKMATRLVKRAYSASGAGLLEFPLLWPDIADSTDLSLRTPEVAVPRDRPLRIAWVTTPPSPGSGGHTTIFRMVAALEAQGHQCELLLYDRFGGRVDRHERVIRETWPWIRARIHDANDPRLESADVTFATSWQSAHVLARRPWSTRRMYFVQDYEPFFYAQGTEYALAEDTYRFGYGIVTVGRMIADLLRDEMAVEVAAVAPFGTDGEVYRLENRGERNGVVFYTKPDVPRRGFQLGAAALAEFHRRRPDQEIHVFGDDVPDLPFPATHHGRVPPAELNRLYNRCRAGIALSFTNVSLVAVEMLASGAIPVANQSAYARAELDNPLVRWAAPTPSRMADVLVDVVSAPDTVAVAEEAAASVHRDHWVPAKAALIEAVERRAYDAS